MMHQRYPNVSTRLLLNSEPTATEKAKAAGRGKSAVKALKAGLAVLSRKRIAALRRHRNHGDVERAGDGPGCASNGPPFCPRFPKKAAHPRLQKSR